MRGVEDVLPGNQELERAIADGRNDGDLDRPRIVGEPDGLNAVIVHFGGAVRWSRGHIELSRMVARILEEGTR